MTAPQLVQLVVRGQSLYGLDANGNVWRSENAVDSNTGRFGDPAKHPPRTLTLVWEPIQQRFQA